MKPYETSNWEVWSERPLRNERTASIILSETMTGRANKVSGMGWRSRIPYHNIYLIQHRVKVTLWDHLNVTDVNLISLVLVCPSKFVGTPIGR